VCETMRKPLMLFNLIHSHSVINALVFTKSAESTFRLVRLLELFEKARLSEGPNARKAVIVRAYSSDLSPSERKNLLQQFKNSEVDL
jgi:ATP-dependent RNA helicase DDX51/DBP6